MANADREMFWSGWALIAIALFLYVWVKRLLTQKKKSGLEPGKVAEFIERGQKLLSRANEDVLPVKEHNAWVGQIENYFETRKRRDYVVRLNDFSGMRFYGDGSEKSKFENSIDGRLRNLNQFISEIATTEN